MKREGIFFRLGLSKGMLQDITAEEVKEHLPVEDLAGEKQDVISQLWHRIKEGGNFWEVVKKPFLARDLNRSQVKEFLRRGLARAEGRWKNLCKILNLCEREYHKFMRFIHEQRLKP